VAEQSLDALLGLVSEHQVAECQRLISDARVQAAQITRAAHRQARSRMHDAIAEERQRAAREISAAQAHVATLRRQHRQRFTVALLDEGWALLVAELQKRWTDPTARAQWVAGLVREAHSRLPAGPQRVVHPADWPHEEQESLAQQLGGAPGHVPQFVEEGAIRAGLRLSADGACVDGTVDGLLADKSAIQGELLALLGGTGQAAGGGVGGG
jgi:vacuolar-type H+-ATPase subunit H